MSNWRLGHTVALDFETTGKYPEVDRVVTACVAFLPQVEFEEGGAMRPRTPRLYQGLANPGIPIHEEATKIHGITDQYAQTHGEDAPKVIDRVRSLLAVAIAEGVPIVGMNLVYDLTMLDRECERYDIEPLAVEPEKLCPVVDVFVIDKAADPYRKGSRKLEALCAHYGVRHEGAHDSTADALAAARIAWKMAGGPIRRAPSNSTRRDDTPPLDIGSMKLDDLHRAQMGWKVGQTKSFARYLRQKAGQEPDPAESNRLYAEADAMRPEWPFVPRVVPEPTAEEQGMLL